jgi:hypothetical protein
MDDCLKLFRYGDQFIGVLAVTEHASEMGESCSNCQILKILKKLENFLI